MTLLRDQGLGLDLAPQGLSPGRKDPAVTALRLEKLLRAVNGLYMDLSSVPCAPKTKSSLTGWCPAHG